MQPLFHFSSQGQSLESAILCEISSEYLCLNCWLWAIFVDELNNDINRLCDRLISAISVRLLHTLEVQCHCDLLTLHSVRTD